ncbi:MAG: glycosyltransferase [Chloroflexota bacterium]|nr:glycosyltransferase [Chloroflexota bacterium]
MSVVIPTHRRPGLLRRCLAALARQEYPPDRLEIVVVEDGEPAGAEEVVAEFRASGVGVDVLFTRIARSGPAAARNAGWQLARGEIIAFTDDDTLADPHWIAASVRSFARGADAVSGRTVVPLPARPTDAQRNAKRLETAPFATCNAFCRRDLLQAVRGFDPRFTSAYREDSDLQFTLLDAGARLVRNADAVVVHPPRPEQPLVSLRQQRNQYFDALLYRKHPASFRQYIRSRPPWRYYAITVGQLVSLLAGLLGQRWVAAAATGSWAVLVTIFCAERLRGSRLRPADVAEMAITSLVIPPVAVYWRLRGAWAFRVRFL